MTLKTRAMTEKVRSTQWARVQPSTMITSENQSSQAQT